MFAVLLVLVSIAAAAVAAISGFGIGSLLTPAFAVAVGARTAIAAVSLPHFAGTVLRFWRISGPLGFVAGIVSGFFGGWSETREASARRRCLASR
ncbi:MAG: hypothetical protein AB7F99_14050 [Vicinamibacterales bacterium]